MKLILLVLAKPLLLGLGFTAYNVSSGRPELKVERLAPKRLAIPKADHLENAPPAVDLPPLKQEDQETKPEKE